MRRASNLAAYLRFAWTLPSFLRQTISLKDARNVVRQRIVEREANFLKLVGRTIFEYPRSPYLPLLKLAGCSRVDLEQMVRTRGLERTLTALRDAGVYVTFEEFKGREPIVRQGTVVPAGPSDFNNPFLARHYYATTGGTTGPGLRVPIDLDHFADRAAEHLVAYEAHGLLRVPTAVWRGILPDGGGLNGMLRGARIGQMPVKWFSPVTRRELRISPKNWLATEGILLIARLAGRPIPRPEPVPLDEAETIARWATRTRDEAGGCLIRAHVSLCLRIALAATARGLHLDGVTFMGGGEPPTPAKVRRIVATGARWIPTYTFVETGQIGIGCARPVDGCDLHFLKSSLALVQHPREVPGVGSKVPAFYFSTLLGSSPKILLNVESDDYGSIESRHCGCPLEHNGYDQHLHSIHSFRKLTGEGVTLIGSEMVRVLEEVLPERFGGTPQDYQLLEEEDERGFTRLSLIVSPRVQSIDDQLFVDAVLEALGRGTDAADLARAIWLRAGALQVKRMEPVWTMRGKLMPLHLAGRKDRAPV